MVNWGFPDNSTVYIDIDVRLRGTPAESQITQALANWTSANRTNGSGVTFNTQTPLSNAPQAANVLHVSFEEFQGIEGNPNRSARARLNTVRSNETAIFEATIFFNTAALANPLDPNSGPFYDPTKPGYDSIFIKEVLHETGHGMGLCHPVRGDQQPGQSVMNNSSSCPNDTCPQGSIEPSGLPTSVQPCDNTRVSEQITVYTTTSAY